jgi:NAD+ kinase
MKPKVIVVTKKTSYSQYIEDDCKDTKIKDLLNTENPVVARWRSAHETHNRTLSKVLEVVQSKAQLFLIDVPHCSFMSGIQEIALVVSVGGDGTLLSASHNLHSNIPILGVNSDPNSSVGFFCAGNENNFEEYFTKAMDNACESISLTRMKVSKNGQSISSRVLNDVLLCHTNPATTSRYILDANGVVESQNSSGFWIGPAAGSTAARRSAGFEALPLVSKSLQLCVRELYYRPGSAPGRREIIAAPGSSIRVLSKMDNAAMYIDGDHKIVPIGLGEEIVFERSEESLLVLGGKDVFRQ